MRRGLRLVVFALIVPGGLVLAVGLGLLMWALREGTARAERAGLRLPSEVLFWSRLWCAWYAVPWDLHLAILRNEGASVAKDGAYPLGDKTARRGPAIGPGQVLRARIDRLWSRGRRVTFAASDFDDDRRDTYDPIPLAMRPLVVGTDPLELALVGQERRALWASVVILREALDEVGGDELEAARRYNGFGAPAQAYAERARVTLEALRA